MTLDQVEQFIEDRNAALLSGDVDKVLAFQRKWNPSAPAPSSREIAEISMHKARIAIRALPLEARLESARWLIKRGYRSFDDGDLSSQVVRSAKEA